MQIEKHLAMAVIGLMLASPTTNYQQTGPGPTPARYDFPLRGGRAVGEFSVEAAADDTVHEISWAGPSVAPQLQRVPPSAPASAYGMDVPLAYYNLSFTLSKRTGGITPPVQARIFAYMGLALYESLVSGMPHHKIDRELVARDRAAPQKRRHQALASRRERSDGRGDAGAVG